MSLGDPSHSLPAGIALGQARGVNQRTTAEVACPRSMVGRVIGKNGETIKALQLYTNALIQIDQSTDPTRVTISGTPQSLELAISMVTDICKGTFKGFALLRQLIQPQRSPTLPGQQPFNLGPSMLQQQRPVYAPGYGLIPPSQLYGDTAGVGGTTTLVASSPGGLTGGAGGMPLNLGGRPVSLQLPPGYQYATLQPSGGLGGDPSQQQVLVHGLGGHHLTATGQLVDGSVAGGNTLLGSMQLPMQQVYSMPAQSGGFAQTVTYAYPQEFITTTGMGGEQLQLYAQSDGTLLSLQPGSSGQSFGGLQHVIGSSGSHVMSSSGMHQQPHHSYQQQQPQQQHQQQHHVSAAGSSMGKALMAAAGAGAHGGSLAARPSSGSSALQVGMGSSGAITGSSSAQQAAPRWSSGSGWVDTSKVSEPTTMGQMATSELLGAAAGGQAQGSGGAGGQGALGMASLTPASGGSGGPNSAQQLVQVIGPEGKVVSYYHLSGSATTGPGSEHQ